VARSMWKGAIQFGLVTIPIKLYLATESSYQVRFHMLHDKDESRIQMKTWCPVDEEIISRADTVKGNEYAPDHTSSLTRTSRISPYICPDDRDRAVHEVDDEDASTRFVKQAYYIEPDKIGRKAFFLLRSVLQDEGLTAICKVVIKDREALAAMDPFGDTMLLTTLHWPDEIRSTKELDLPDETFDFKPAELAMAKQLVSAMTGDFEPENYKDDYRDALMKVIEAKVEGTEPEEIEQPEEGGNLVDLMAALEASVKATKAARESVKPVSVAEAKEQRAARSTKPTTRRRSRRLDVADRGSEERRGRVGCVPPGKSALMSRAYDGRGRAARRSAASRARIASSGQVCARSSSSATRQARGPRARLRGATRSARQPLRTRSRRSPARAPSGTSTAGIWPATATRTTRLRPDPRPPVPAPRGARRPI
jgi:DNA end-binding protein Ku